MLTWFPREISPPKLEDVSTIYKVEERQASLKALRCLRIKPPSIGSMCMTSSDLVPDPLSHLSHLLLHPQHLLNLLELLECTTCSYQILSLLIGKPPLGHPFCLS